MILKRCVDFLLGERRGRLVHDEDVGVVGHRLGDLDHLPVGDGEVAHFRLGVDGDVEPVEQRLGAAAHLVVVDEAEGVQRLAADPDVFGHRHEGHQVEFLMDHRDAVLQRVERRRQLDFLALQLEGAGVGRVDAGDDLHQRRLAGAVLAHQRVNVAALQPERDVVERQHAGKGLADVLDLEQIFGAGNGAALPDDFGGGRTDGRHGASSRPFDAALVPEPGRCHVALSSTRPEARPGGERASGRLAAGRGGRASDQFFFVNWSMLAGVTSWKGM